MYDLDGVPVSPGQPGLVETEPLNRLKLEITTGIILIRRAPFVGQGIWPGKNTEPGRMTSTSTAILCYNKRVLREPAGCRGRWKKQADTTNFPACGHTDPLIFREMKVH